MLEDPSEGKIDKKSFLGGKKPSFMKSASFQNNNDPRMNSRGNTDFGDVSIEYRRIDKLEGKRYSSLDFFVRSAINFKGHP